jgi:chorismate mutase
MMDSPSLPHRSSGIPTQMPQASASAEQSLEHLRDEIDHLDSALLDLLAQRQQVVHAIGDYKRARNLAPLDLERWQTMLTALEQKAEVRGLCRHFVRNLYEEIHEYSLRLEGEKAPSGSEVPSP